MKEEKKTVTTEGTQGDNAESRQEVIEKRDGSRRGWKDVFKNATYAGGPGENIYVFG